MAMAVQGLLVVLGLVAAACGRSCEIDAAGSLPGAITGYPKGARILLGIARKQAAYALAGRAGSSALQAFGVMLQAIRWALRNYLALYFSMMAAVSQCGAL
ncbi:hypothetical protein P308_17940 [Pseudomonas piscis]|nr:hypothetical protein P308_17940 [Pseudomonas piscis]